jgi:hypothetical protein
LVLIHPVIKTGELLYNFVLNFVDAHLFCSLLTWLFCCFLLSVFHCFQFE